MKYDFVEDKKVVAVKKFDAQSAVDHMKGLFEKQIKSMKKKAEAFLVTDENSMIQASEMAAQAKKFSKAVGASHKAIKAPYLAFTKVLDELKRNINRPLDEIQKLLEGKVAPVALAIEEKHEAERKAAEAKAAKEAAKVKTLDTPIIITPKLTTAPSAINDGKIKSQTGSVNVTKVTRWRLVDFSKVPRSFKITTLDEHKITDAVKSGSQIPGIQTYIDADVKTRLNR